MSELIEKLEKYIECGHYTQGKCTIAREIVIKHKETLKCDHDKCVIIEGDGILSCEYNPVMVPQMIRVTEKGIKQLKSNLMYWFKKPQFEKVIGEFYALPEEERNKIIEQSLGVKKYPVLTVDAVIPINGGIVLIQRKKEPFKGQWALPGGKVEFLESLRDAIIREVREETGLGVEPVRMIGVYDDPVYRDPRGHYISVAYLCKIIGNTDIRAGSDAEEARIFSCDKIREKKVQLAFDHHQIVIDAQKNRGGELMECIILCDLDDTLAYPSPYRQVDQKLPLSEQHKYAQSPSFKQALLDVPLAPWVRKNTALLEGRLIIPTGRWAYNEPETRQWLKAHGIVADEIVFLNFDGYAGYLEKKGALVQRYCGDCSPENVRVIDDNREVVDRARELGCDGIFIERGYIGGSQDVV